MVPFAYLRACAPIHLSSPGYFVGGMRKFQNLLFNDNVLCIAIEFDTRRVLNPEKGSLFAVIAETVP